MIHATITGNIGKDAETRQAGQDSVTSFSVASNRKVKGEDTTTWVRVSCWGKRGESLCKHLVKGTRVTVVGELSTREHDGKTYLECRMNELDFSNPKQGGDSSRGTSAAYEKHEAKKHGRDDETAQDLGGSDDIPF